MMPLRLQAYTQLCSSLIDGLVDDALWNAPVTLYITLTRGKMHHFRHFTSEQNKVSKSEVVEKFIPVANF